VYSSAHRSIQALRGRRTGRLVGTAFVAAPVAMLAAWILLKGVWRPDLGLPWLLDWTVWTVSHVLYVAAIGAFGVVAVALSRAVGRHSSYAERASWVALAITLASLLAFLGQVLLDLVVSFGAGSRAGMSAGFDALHRDHPLLVDLTQGPLAMIWMVGLLALMILATITRAVRIRDTALLTVGALLLLPQSTLLGLVGIVFVGLALVPVGLRLSVAGGQDAASTVTSSSWTPPVQK